MSRLLKTLNLKRYKEHSDRLEQIVKCAKNYSDGNYSDQEKKDAFFELHFYVTGDILLQYLSDYQIPLGGAHTTDSFHTFVEDFNEYIKKLIAVNQDEPEKMQKLNEEFQCAQELYDFFKALKALCPEGKRKEVQKKLNKELKIAEKELADSKQEYLGLEKNIAKLEKKLYPNGRPTPQGRPTAAHPPAMIIGGDGPWTSSSASSSQNSSISSNGSTHKTRCTIM